MEAVEYSQASCMSAAAPSPRFRMSPTTRRDIGWASFVSLLSSSRKHSQRMQAQFPPIALQSPDLR
eukprot:scaffold243541_cov32-Tisochrysis_lutea.AAC.2